MPSLKPVDPAPEDALAAFALHAVRGIEIAAEVKEPTPFRLKTRLFRVEVSHEVLHPPVGGDDQDPLFPELEEIRALDVHGLPVRMAKQDAQVLPPGELGVLRAVERHHRLAALPLVEVTAKDQVSLALVPEEKGIAPIVDLQATVESLGQHGVRRMLLPDEEVRAAEGGPLLRRVLRPLFWANAGVEKDRLAVAIDRRAAGKAVVFANFLRGPQGDGEVLPADEVPAPDMPPVHVAPAVAVGVVLVEKVIKAAVEDRPVGIVVPPGRWGNVEDRASWIQGSAIRTPPHARHGSSDGVIGIEDGPRSIVQLDLVDVDVAPAARVAVNDLYSSLLL